jgi:hypothetical protein
MLSFELAMDMQTDVSSIIILISQQLSQLAKYKCCTHRDLHLVFTFSMSPCER